jgi:hypothetical protein
MATHRKKQRYTAQQRQEYVERFARSGLKQAEFCRRAKLHPMTFSLWRRRLKATAAVFAEVQVNTPAPVPAGDAPVLLGGAAVLHLRDGAKLEVALAGETAWAGLGLMLKTLQA